LGQSITIEEANYDRILTFYLESDEALEVILLEGRVKQRVIDSTGSNIGESVTKQRRVDGVTQFKGKIKRDTKYMVEISGKAMNFGAVGKCEYGKAHISLWE
jgi:hypothetical protein